MKPIQTGDVVGNYRVIEIAGSGGMGAVYKIEHIITRRIEAMKFLPPGASNDPDQLQRFEREIQVQARLHHPNIVALYNAVLYGSSMALVMEFVEGESLQRMVAAGPLPVETAVDVASQVLSALAYSHDAGVIHRDVSPANIIFTGDHIAKLTDFGLARGVTDLRLSTSGAPLGSPWYMSPEQVKGTVALDARTDLYAMGAVLHEMLTGAKLFEAEGAFAVMRAQVESEPAPPSSRNPKVPAALDEIVRKAVAKDPAMRFQSADEFRLALRNAAAGTLPSPMEATTGLEHAPVPRMTSRLPGIHSWRAAVLVALVPTVLVAGFYTIRYFPATARAGSKPHAASSKPGAAQAPPPVVLRVEPEAPVVVPQAPPEVATETEKPAPIVRRRTRVPQQTARRNGKPEPGSAIRVSGEPQLTAATPAPGSVPGRPVEAAGRQDVKTDSEETPAVEARPEAVETAPELGTAPQGTAKPQNTGNRFVRALGKLNPFKGTKRDPAEGAKTPLKKD